MSPPPAGRPRSKGEYGNTIVRTPEHEEFVRKLTEFNSSRGNVLQKEPVLGGQRLDIYQIYKLVIEGGGFARVTSTRRWRHISETFNLPATCTNSAYILKQIYRRNLLAWELEHQNGIFVGPQLSVARTWNELPKAAMSHPVSVSERAREYTYFHPRQVNSSPLQAPSYVRSGEAYIPHMQVHQAQGQGPIANISYNQSNPPSEVPRFPPEIPSTDNLYRRQEESSPYYNGLRSGEDEYLLGGGPRNRITLALMSKLPNEIDWAMNTLSIVSFTKHCRIAALPGLLDALLEIVSPVLDPLKLVYNTGKFSLSSVTIVCICPVECSSSGDSEKGFCMEHSVSDPPMFTVSDRVLEKREHCLMAFHSLRNLSFIDENAAIMAKDAKLRRYVVLSSALPPWSFYTQLKHSALDILDNLMNHMDSSWDQAVIVGVIFSCISMDDIGVVSTALPLLAKFIYKSELPADLQPGSRDMSRIISLCTEFLLSSNETLVLSSLNVLYEYALLGFDFVDYILSVSKIMSIPKLLLQLSNIGVRNDAADLQSDSAENIPSLEKQHDGDGEIHLCNWVVLPAPPSTTARPTTYKSCGAKFPTPNHIFQHIQKVHLSHIVLRKEFYLTQPLLTLLKECVCLWGRCTWKMGANVQLPVTLESYLAVSSEERLKAYNFISWKLIIHVASHFKEPSETQTSSNEQIHINPPHIDKPLNSVARMALMLLACISKYSNDKSIFIALECMLVEGMLSNIILEKEISRILSEL